MNQPEYVRMDKYSVGAIALRIIEQMMMNPSVYQQYPKELKLMFDIVERETYPMMIINKEVKK